VSATPSTGPLEIGSPELQAVIDEIAEGAFERERDGVAPHAAIDVVRRSRLGALRVPRELGGSGASVRELFGVLIELASVDPNVAHILRAHFFFVESRLHLPEVERALWLGRVADGAIFGNATTEVGPRDTGGYEAAGFQTVVTEDGDGYRLNGVKYYSTGSLYSDWVAVMARGPRDTLVSAIIPVDRGGVRLGDDWDGFGQSLTGTGTTYLDDVRVEASELSLDGDRAHLRNYAGPFLQLYLSALLAGIARAATRDAVALVRGRERNYTHASAARPADDPLLQEIVGGLASNAYAAESIVLASADAIQAVADSVVDGGADPELADAAQLKVAQTKHAVDLLVRASGWDLFEVGGASATKASRNLDRHWRNARTVTSHNPRVYKNRAVGDVLINDVPLPPSFFF
jgi:alkylation response protein AidB-like acyl-CoA dehydrogenase